MTYIILVSFTSSLLHVELYVHKSRVSIGVKVFVSLKCKVAFASFIPVPEIAVTLLLQCSPVCLDVWSKAPAIFLNITGG